MAYAERTHCTTVYSRIEIEEVVREFNGGSFQFFSAYEDDKHIVSFIIGGVLVRFVVPVPGDEDLAVLPSGRKRSKRMIQKAREKIERQRWRALLLLIKAKTEAVTAGLTTVENEFLPYIVSQTGRTVGQNVLESDSRDLSWEGQASS